jgi:hypothetical protein
MAQEVVQDVQTQYQEEIMKVTKSMLLDLLRKVEKLYDKLGFAGAYIGRVVEDGYWGVFEKIEGAEKDVKDALVKLNGTLIELGVNPSTGVAEEEVEEIKNERRQMLEMIYNIFNELADVYNRDIMFLMDYLLDHKVYDLYGKVDYVRRALWSALLNLVDAIYDLATC